MMSFVQNFDQIFSVYKLDMLLLIDESGTNRRHTLHKYMYGYSLVEKPALCTSVVAWNTLF